MTSEPEIVEHEFHTDSYGFPFPDTTGFSSLLETFTTTDGAYRMIGGRVQEGRRLYSVVPVDALDRRALP